MCMSELVEGSWCILGFKHGGPILKIASMEQIALNLERLIDLAPFCKILQHGHCHIHVTIEMCVHVFVLEDV